MHSFCFYGAGKIGQRTLNRWRKIGICPDYFIDSDELKHGTFLDDIPIIAFSQIKAVSNPVVLITVKNDTEEIMEKLISAGIPSFCIYTLFGNGEDFISEFYETFFRIPIQNSTAQNKLSKKILFDVGNGLVLGGVERWSINSASLLKKKGLDVSFFTNNLVPIDIKVSDIPIITTSCNTDFSNLDWAITITKKLEENLPLTIVCNFPTAPLLAACAIKRKSTDSIHIIAVVHNDEDAYFQYCGFLEKYIDHVLVISRKIQKKLISVGIPESKLIKLSWNIETPKQFCRAYSKSYEPIRIGYAGRVVVQQKRMDILFSVALQLKKIGIDFLLQIAGTGDYEDTLIELIKVNDLQKSIQLLGYIENTNINEFWKRQDIFISCSDYEGHSISKSEAMAQGCVPVVTETSGAEDDITNGKNGFIVTTGDANAIVKKIVYLVQNREELSKMGYEAYKKIRNSSCSRNIGEMWDKILV